VSDVPVKAKPESPPRFWYRQAFFAWLLEQPFDWCEAGHHGPAVDTRLHVRIRPDLGTADEGFLFLTSGLEFARPGRADCGGPGRLLSACRRLGLWVDVADDVDLVGVRPLGGERRLAAWEPGPPAPEPPEGLLERLLVAHRARVVLVTPAAFRRGYLPDERSLAGAPVVAVACARPLVVSGWDLERRRPKPTRRLVPAGSVYFVEFPRDWGDREVAAWLRRLWFQNVSDDEQDRLDGYGLATVGVRG
jgi:CRISPR-associated protein Cmr3